jgi:hypothetical protein
LENASAITVPRQDRDSIRRFSRDVFGGTIVKEHNEKDIFRLQEDFYILFRYGDVPDDSEFLRSPRALWLQIKSCSPHQSPWTSWLGSALRLRFPSLTYAFSVV